jgi:hypothetical protein
MLFDFHFVCFELLFSHIITAILPCDAADLILVWFIYNTRQ